MPINHLAENVLRLRRAAGLTLDELAARTGVSRAMISKVERGTSDPTATVLGKLASGLDVSISQLLGDPAPRTPRVLARTDQTAFHDPVTGFRRRSLSPLFEGAAVDFVFNALPAGQSASFSPHHCGVEEYLALHEGSLVVVIDGERFVLSAGDSIFYPGDTQHEYRNEGCQPAVFYTVIDDRAAR
ncbi:MAG: XRE family transcriptional regulator [Acidovorax sp.]